VNQTRRVWGEANHMETHCFVGALMIFLSYFMNIGC
jgi:hypothetical protein